MFNARHQHAQQRDLEVAVGNWDGTPLRHHLRLCASWGQGGRLLRRHQHLDRNFPGLVEKLWRSATFAVEQAPSRSPAEGEALSPPPPRVMGAAATLFRRALRLQPPRSATTAARSTGSGWNDQPERGAVEPTDGH